MLNEQDILVRRAIELAKQYKYWLLYSNPLIDNILQLHKIRYTSFYNTYSKIFLKIAKLEDQYKFNADMFIKFASYICKIQEHDIKSKLLTFNMFNDFINWRSDIAKKKNIYSNYRKSIINIAKICIDNDILTTKDFLRMIIKQKKIADYFITGKISMYYFAAIPNFKNIISKLDPFAKAEFLKIGDRFEMYNAEITDAYMQFKKQKVNPIKNTDDAILALRNSTNV